MSDDRPAATHPTLPGSTPRELLDRMLGYLTFLHGASGALLCHVDRDQPMVEAVRSMRPARIADLATVWAEALPMLRAGETLAGDDYVLAPLLGTGGLVGVLWLDAPSKFQQDGLRRWCDGLARNLTAARRMGPETSPVGLVSVRQETEDMLERFGWNVAQTARALAVCRRTLYMRMEKFGIVRPR